VIGFEQEWKQKVACSQGDLEVYCHEKIPQILNPKSFEFFGKLLLFQQKLCSWIQMRLHVCQISALALKFESEVLKEVTGSTV
jgi:hypothetical protein